MQLNSCLKLLRWPVAVLALHFVATYFGWYWHWTRLDNLLHFLGGCSIAMSAAELFNILTDRRNTFVRPDKSITGNAFKKQNLNFRWVHFLFTVGMVALAAMLWEFMELGMDYFFNVKMQPDLVDTMSDMALALLGGLLVFIMRLRFRNWESIKKSSRVVEW